MKSSCHYNILMLPVVLVLTLGCAHAPEKKAGEVSVAETVVQRQLDAYNARDVDAFLETYSPTIKIYFHPAELRYEGREPMRERYGKMFANTPNLHCEILNRIILGNKVIDREYVTGFPDGRAVNAVAIYEVIDGFIQNVWFLRESEP